MPMSSLRLLLRAAQARFFRADRGHALEMRLFSRAALLRELADAGFARSRVADEDWIDYGIAWPEPFSVPIVAYASADAPSPTTL